jgi:serine/threonine protein phosphatase PrpC
MHYTIVATASETNKSKNQDNNGEFKVDSSNYVFVTDGLNSIGNPQHASHAVIDSFHESIARLAPQDINFLHSYMGKLYQKTRQGTLRSSHKKNAEKILGNTAILVCEKPDKIIIAHSGNGAIWHIKGNFNSFPDSFSFPWNAFNLLNPYKSSGKAKAVTIQPDSDNTNSGEYTPTIIEIQKNKEYGDIILICTDGIYSTNQLKDKNEKGVWTTKNKIYIFKIFSYLNHFFHSNKLQDSNALKEMLKLYLQELKPFLEDDATIGILITSAAIECQDKTKLEGI